MRLGPRVGSAALGRYPRPGQNVPRHRLEDSLGLQPETSVRAHQQCLIL